MPLHRRYLSRSPLPRLGDAHWHASIGFEQRGGWEDLEQFHRLLQLGKTSQIRFIVLRCCGLCGTPEVSLLHALCRISGVCLLNIKDPNAGTGYRTTREGIAEIITSWVPRKTNCFHKKSSPHILVQESLCRCNVCRIRRSPKLIPPPPTSWANNLCLKKRASSTQSGTDDSPNHFGHLCEGFQPHGTSPATGV